MSKTIERVLKNTVVFDDPEKLRDTLVVEKTRLVGLLDNLLPVEVAARKPVEDSLHEIDTRLSQIEISEKFPGLAMLDKSVFDWAKEQVGWSRGIGKQKIVVPQLAYLPVTQPRLRLIVDHHMRTYFTPDSLPQSIVKSYTEILTDLARRHLSWDGREKLSLTYTYPGVIPDHIREIIRTEQQMPRRFDELAFVCDVTEWQVGSQMSTAFADPILVGCYGQTLWVLDSFDPTPVETYLLREFTS